MFPREVIERFIEESPVTVMARLPPENALPPPAVDPLIDREVQILTDLTDDLPEAGVVAAIHRKRWTLGARFREMEATVNGEITTPGSPHVALLAICMALVAYARMGAIKGALRSVHGAGGSASDLAEEVTGATRGVLITVSQDEWAVFHSLPACLRDGRGTAGPRAAGAPVSIPKATARAEGAEAREGRWSREVASVDGEGAQGSSRD